MQEGQASGGWADVVTAVAAKRGLRYEPVGGINPVGEPVALCPGGTNRLTGELAAGFWGSACDAEEERVGRLFSKTVLPRAVLCKSHMPDLADAVPDFSIEAVEGKPEDLLLRRDRRRVQFESIEFSRRYIATVEEGADPVPVRELFSPSLLDWMAELGHSCDCGLGSGQFFVLWRYRERSADELEAGLDAAGGIFRRVHAELEESGARALPVGPWNAGLEPFAGALG